MVFNKLTPGSLYGSRVIMPFENYLIKKEASQGYHVEIKNNDQLESYYLNNLLDLVADSSQVEMIFLDKHQFYGSQNSLSLNDNDIRTLWSNVLKQQDIERGCINVKNCR